MVPGERVTVRVPMQSTAYAVPAGHALRLAVSPTYWPWIWPSPEPVALTVVGGALELPVRSRLSARRRPARVRAARGRPGLTVEPRRIGLDRPHASRATSPRGAVDVGFLWKDGAEVIAETATELAERNEVHYRVGDDPLSAEVEAAVEVELARGDWRSRVAVRGTMTCRPRRASCSPRRSTPMRARRAASRAAGPTAIPRDGG